MMWFEFAQGECTHVVLVNLYIDFEHILPPSWRVRSPFAICSLECHNNVLKPSNLNLYSTSNSKYDIPFYLAAYQTIQIQVHSTVSLMIMSTMTLTSLAYTNATTHHLLRSINWQHSCQCQFVLMSSSALYTVTSSAAPVVLSHGKPSS
jgi:hypothetical protein